MDLEDRLADHRLVVADHFDAATLDDALWLPYHLPQWSSRDQAAARWSLTSDGLALRVDADQPPWCPEFDDTTRVSSLQTGVRSGPVGSTDGQHRFADDVVVREDQPATWLHTPTYGAVVLRAKVDLHEHSMAALWMVGIEDQPHQSGVIDVMEVFGRDVTPTTAAVGMNVKAFADPTLSDDEERPRLAIDARTFHDYAAVWQDEDVTFFVDGREVRRVRQSPDYPMQIMLGVYSFEPASEDAFVPTFTVRSFRSYAPRPQ